MRKDYMDATDVESGAEEAVFVDRYWANVWKQQGGAPDMSGMEARDEYRVIEPYLRTLAPGSRILDAAAASASGPCSSRRRASPSPASI